jgi:hypothetical protein
MGLANFPSKNARWVIEGPSPLVGDGPFLVHLGESRSGGLRQRLRLGRELDRDRLRFQRFARRRYPRIRE